MKADLPRGIGELQRQWHDLPPTVTPDEVLGAGWVAMSRAPFYRALARQELPAVKLGRRTLILTVPLLRMLGVVD